MDNIKQKYLPQQLKRLKYYNYNDILKLVSRIRFIQRVDLNNFRQGKKSKLNPDKVPDQQVDDLFTINYTSGSTGMPKGVMHSNKAFLAGNTPIVFSLLVSISQYRV